MASSLSCQLVKLGSVAVEVPHGAVGVVARTCDTHTGYTYEFTGHKVAFLGRDPICSNRTVTNADESTCRLGSVPSTEHRLGQTSMTAIQHMINQTHVAFSKLTPPWRNRVSTQSRSGFFIQT